MSTGSENIDPDDEVNDEDFEKRFDFTNQFKPTLDGPLRYAAPIKKFFVVRGSTKKGGPKRSIRLKQVEVVIAMNKICEYSEIQDEQQEIRENRKVIDSILTSKTKLATEEDMDLIGISAIIEPKIVKKYLANHNALVERVQTLEKENKNGGKSNKADEN